MADIRDAKAATIVADSKAETFATKTRGVSVEIQKPRAIPGGVEVLARAWKDGVPIGFGADGSVEWERFRVYNPPLMVPDGTKRSHTNEHGFTYDVDNFILDPDEALRQVIAHNVKLVGKPSAKVTPGKIGNTTSTFYPDADPESTSVDGMVSLTSADTWANTRAAASGGTALPSSASSDLCWVRKTATHHSISRGFALFDTSALPDADDITSATLSMYLTAKNDADNDAEAFFAVVTSAPASNTDIVLADYSTLGTTEQHDAGERKDITTISLNVYTDWVLNATGRGNISKTGVTKFGFREGHDLLDSSPAEVADGNYATTSYAETSGTTQDPKLVVVHSAFNTLAPMPQGIIVG